MLTEGQRLLRRYIDTEKITQRVLAKRVARSEPTVSLWLSGGLPDVVSAVKIERVTNGAVPAKAWAQKPRGRAA